MQQLKADNAETKVLRLIFMQRSYPEIFFKLWETVTCDLLLSGRFKKFITETPALKVKKKWHKFINMKVMNQTLNDSSFITT